MAMEERKQKRFVDAKTVWSVRTRAAMVRFGAVGKLMRRASRENQVVAAGPKTAGGREGGVSLWGAEGNGGGVVEGGLYRRRRGPFGLCVRNCACRAPLSRLLAGP